MHQTFLAPLHLTSEEDPLGYPGLCHHLHRPPLLRAGDGHAQLKGDTGYSTKLPDPAKGWVEEEEEEEDLSGMQMHGARFLITKLQFHVFRVY